MNYRQAFDPAAPVKIHGSGLWDIPLLAQTLTLT